MSQVKAKSLKELGFTNVRYYDTYQDEDYFDATLWSGERVEVVIRSNKTIEWRHLGVKNTKDVVWTEVGKFNPKQKEPTPRVNTPAEEVVYKEEDTGQLTLF